MRKYGGFFLTVLLISLLFCSAALAQTYTFSGPQVSQNLIDDDYDVVLTHDNLSEHEDWLTANGYTVEGMQAIFESEGILLEAVDSANDRTFILSALVTVDSEMYFDLNKQDEAMRKEFRTSHTNGEAYGLLGYTYSHATWQNYGGTKLRFLKTEYSFKENGQIEYYGFQRRTIRNGYLITLDMQVSGRTLKSADEKALNSLFDGFSFTEVISMPKLPAKLSFSSEPPLTTASGTFTVKGTTASNANVTVNILSLTSTYSQTIEESANRSGAFSTKISLPDPGVYSIVISAEGEETLRTKISFSVSYQK